MPKATRENFFRRHNAQGVPMTIDLEGLSEQELVELNRRIVARYRLLSEQRAQQKMSELRLGDSVSFQPRGHPVLFGTLIRINRKTVTVVVRDGKCWTVPPELLRREDWQEIGNAPLPAQRIIDVLP